MKTAFGVLVVLLFLCAAGRFIFKPLDVKAEARTFSSFPSSAVGTYKVISSDGLNNEAACEKLLNDMAGQGWTFVGEVGRMLVFKK